MKPVEVSVDFGGRPLTLQTGKLAKQADASVLATYGETVVLVAVVSAKELKPAQDFFPLTVDFQEKYYAAGKIPGGFFKREAKPSERATLSARLIDRPLRPLFPEDFLCETNVTVTVLSVDPENEPDVIASIAASAALHISDIPFDGPVGTCRVGLVDGKFIANIPPSQQPDSLCELLVSGVRTGVVMVEGESKEISEKQMIDAIDFAHQQMQAIFDLQDELKKKVGKAKREYPKAKRNPDLKKKIRTAAWGGLEKSFAIREKLARYQALSEVKTAIKTQFVVAEPKTEEEKTNNSLVGMYFEETKSEFARELTLNSKHRIDGRKYDAIRDITCEVGLLPRVHGSALFTRGETQVLAAITLGTSDDEQKVDSILGTYQKGFMLHYNFPPFSVGEARPLRPPGRREVGHGFLAEKALSFIIPSKEVFPYTIRLVSEVLESNGSSSMATVCSGSMALMQAGVPVAKPVAGVAMGLIKEGEKYAVLSDILGDEDHLGDMDFKVCGTEGGITAFQMDLKIGGVSRQIMEEALEQARAGRIHVLGKMNACIAESVTAVSRYAPRIFSLKVKPEKVREVIGAGGKVIRSIIDRTGVKIDIEDDGKINIASADEVSAQKAIDIINQIIAEPEIGKIYEGKVTRIADFGAFVEIFPGTDGLCHISELEHSRVRRVDDVVKEGDIIRVKCLDVDAQGKIRLSRKALLPKPGAPTGGGSGGSSSETPRDAEAPVSGDAQPAAVEARAEHVDSEDTDEEDQPPLRADEGTEGHAENDELDNVGNRIDRGGDRPHRGSGGRGHSRSPGYRGESRGGEHRESRPRQDRGEGGYNRGPRRDSGERDSGGRRPPPRSGGRSFGGRGGQDRARSAGGGHSRHGGGGGGRSGGRFGRSDRGERSGGSDRGAERPREPHHREPRERSDSRPERYEREERFNHEDRGFAPRPEREPRSDHHRSEPRSEPRHERAERPERQEAAPREIESRDIDRIEPWEQRPYLYDDED